MTLIYDVVICGAGSGGISCAWNCARLGLKTLLIEKNIHSGGLMTSGLVVPVMKLNSLGINDDFYNALIEKSKAFGAQIQYSDGNRGWFNPEIIKSVFDTMLTDVNCDILYNVSIGNIAIKNKIYKLKIDNILSKHIEAKYLVDGTGDAKIFQKLNLEILKDKNEKQSLSMRFLMSGVDCKRFSEWILELDKDRNVTTSCEVNGQTHFSTAYTWDEGRKWALRQYFMQAVNDGVLKPSDTAYFQVFTVAGMPDAVAFNCPRLMPCEEPSKINKDDIFEQSNLIIEGRARINRIAEFCRKYLKGFENAYVSNISDMLGIRESVRVKGKKVFTVKDIENGEKPENIALASDYPIDVHSDKKNNSELKFTNHIWYLPLECLISEKYDNLFVVGRCLSAEFRAQAAVRTQANCFSMGEAVAKHIKNTI